MSMRSPRLSVGPKKNLQYVRKNSPARTGKSSYPKLQFLVNTLNHRANHGPWSESTQENDAWRKIEYVVSTVAGQIPRAENERTILFAKPLPPSLEWGAITFNQEFKHVSVRLAVSVNKEGTEPWPELLTPDNGDDHAATAAAFLWRYYFSDGGWERVKRCCQCHAWFVDRGKNKRARFCELGDGKCRERWWNRPTRRLKKRARERETAALGASEASKRSITTQEQAVTLLGKVKREKEKKMARSKRPAL